MNASIRVAQRGVIVTKAYKPGALELIAFSTTVVMYLDGKKQPNVVEIVSAIPLNDKSYAVGSVPIIQLDSDSDKECFVVPYFCACRVSDSATANMDVTMVNEKVKVGSHVFDCDVPALKNNVQLNKGDEVKVYKVEQASSSSEPPVKKARGK